MKEAIELVLFECKLYDLDVNRTAFIFRNNDDKLTLKYRDEKDRKLFSRILLRNFKNIRKYHLSDKWEWEYLNLPREITYIVSRPRQHKNT